MTEDKIQHTDALSLCNRLTHLNKQISSLQHELVLHYSATGVPTHKTINSIECLKREMEQTREHLETVKRELDGIDR